MSETGGALWVHKHDHDPRAVPCRRGCPQYASVQREKRREARRERWRQVARRLPCLLRGHRWVGYGQNPLPFITCERCGLLP